ncbi:hypothetical protein [Planococcus halotolerans]|uniref:Uncharacterized protein n=1 Tax=Planococcus halotolerans TaxID=2233542 RepID=A0A365KK09_9BACL|nr:hypothetical protein [Planococcus halotolerans]RAZ73455.1 hypothetical protein DP120_17130 [Planococcus halotolerans]
MSDRIIELIISVFETNPVVILFILIFSWIFIWLTKEIRIQLDKERNDQETEVKTSLEVLCRILSEGEKYRSHRDKENFFSAIYAALPFIDYRFARELLSGINQEETPEEQRILNLTELVHNKILILTPNNKVFSNSMYLFEDVEKMFFRIWNVIRPAILSFCVLIFAILLWMIAFPLESQFWAVVKPACFTLSGVLLVFTIDLIKDGKRIKLISTIFGSSSVLSLITVFSPEKYSWIPLSLFIILLSTAFYMGIKDKKKNT